MRTIGNILQIASLLLMPVANVQAQKVDFDLVGKNGITEIGYTSCGLATGKDGAVGLPGGVRINISSDTGMLTSNWYKTNMTREGSLMKLLSDGITVKMMQPDHNMIEPTEAVQIELKIEGLSTGHHSLLAYHNNVDGYKNAKLPPICIKVNGKEKSGFVEQSQRATSVDAAAFSYIDFDAQASEPVVVTYYTKPQKGEEYSTTSFYLNGLVFDCPNPRMIATMPTPESGDRHAALDDADARLTWKAGKTATKHLLFFAEDSIAVASATAPLVEATSPEFPISAIGRLSALRQYYWRVDEVDNDGRVYRGEVWTFQPRRDAFPGAEGYGRYAIGGRGGSVYHVTSLSDENVPGTFRYGILSIHGPRTIVFDVSGVISLGSRLTCTDPYVTIVGQTAPGRGILFRSSPFGMASDGITRFIRLRKGHGVTADGLGMAGNDNSIMDHCSVGWTIDEAFSSRNCKNITLQRTLISEALNIAGHKNYPKGKMHGYAATIGGNYGSYHHNLLAHNEGRNWSLSGGLDGNGYYAGHHDVFNNVCYNWYKRATDGGTHECNYVSNYYKMGPDTEQKFTLRAQLEGTGNGSQSYYIAGNIRENKDGSKTRDSEGETYRYELSNGQKQTWQVFADKPFFPSYANIETAEAAYKNVLSDVGCNQPQLDNHDERMISETLSGTTSTVGSLSGLKGLIDSEEDAGCEGFEGLNIVEEHRAANFDTDQDGIPDWYEDLKGWDKHIANNNEDSDGDDYTDLEDYLNWMATPHYIINKGEKFELALSELFRGYASPSYTITASEGVLVKRKGNSAKTKIITKIKQHGFFTITVTASEEGASLSHVINIAVE